MSFPEVSVVIPTLGGLQLQNTVNSVNAGSLVPKKIFICIPESYEVQAPLDAHDNVVLIRTKIRGQVGQRAIGLGLADTTLIVQLDDDILVEKDCLAGLVDAWLQLGPDCALAPSFLREGTQISLYRIDTRSLLKKIYFWLLNGSAGYAPGCITRAGTAFGVDLLAGNTLFVETEWLPGGCVLHHRNNVITDNYFPFSGKAFSEDLYFSKLAREKGLKLYVCRDSRCYVEPMTDSASQTLNEIMKQFSGDIRARKKYVKDTDRSIVRMYVYYAMLLTSVLLRKCRKSI